MRYSILTVLLAAAIVIVPGCKKDEKNKEATASMVGPRAVDVAYPMVDSITLYKQYPGYLTSNAKVDVVGRVNGQLLTKNFNDGDYVHKGQVLFTIESTTYRDAVRRAQSALETARSEYEYASRNYSAMNKALAEDAVAAISVVQAKSSMEEAAAAIKSAEAALEDAKTNLSYCTVTAPVSGHIASPVVTVGGYINGGGAPVIMASIYDDSSFGVEFSIEENQYDLLQSASTEESRSVYTRIPLTFKEKLQHSYSANLNYTSPSINKSTGTLLLRGRVENPYNELRNDMYCVANFPYGTNSHAILIPDASIGTDQLGKYVYVVNDSNKIVYTPIKVGDLYRDSLRIVEEGLTPQSRYVTKALLTVRNGETVKPILTK